MFRPIDALNVLCAQLTHDLFAIAKFFYTFAITLADTAQLVTMFLSRLRSEKNCGGSEIKSTTSP